MKNRKRRYQFEAFVLFSIFISILINGCGGKEVIPPPNWSFQEKAINISIKASPQLNMFQGLPHTLVMCVYQLQDPNGFNLYIQDQKGLTDLLRCNRFDTSVLGFKRIVVQPGASQKLQMDRAENARYIGIVAGYYSLYARGAARLYEVPVIIEEKGIFAKEKRKVPGILNINLYLGPYGIK